MVALNNAVWKPPRLTGSFWWEKIHPENDSILNLNSDYHTKLQLIPCMTSGGFGNIMITKACQTITETYPFFFDLDLIHSLYMKGSNLCKVPTLPRPVFSGRSYSQISPAYSRI